MNLTDRAFWINYWENKVDLNLKVGRDYILSKILIDLNTKHKFKSAIELGGYPGYYAIYLKKYLNVKSTLLDYVILKNQVSSLLHFNDMKQDEIELIETDLFNFNTPIKYDLVMSVGLIEHFQNTKEIISKHKDFLNKDGVLFINIPNFTGFNGFLQKSFDVENYKKHYIECMNPKYLKDICFELGFKDVEAFYYGSFMIWLENINQKSRFFKLLFKFTWLIFKVFFKIFPFETKYFSPYINIIAK